MQEIGIESSVLEDIRAGRKTIEGWLGKAKFLQLKAGDVLALREDIWKEGVIVRSQPSGASIVINEVLYFETFSEMLESLDYKAVIPSALNIEGAIREYRRFYSAADEEKFGVAALLFDKA